MRNLLSNERYFVKPIAAAAALHIILLQKFLDAGIQDVSTSISIVHDLVERYWDDDDGDESDKHI